MKERPILFSGPMVRAIMDGRKTMTRRVVKPQPEMVFDGESLSDGNAYGGWEPKLPPWSKWPYQLGDTLWVRETWQGAVDGDEPLYGIIYRASWNANEPAFKRDDRAEKYFTGVSKWRPSIHMPRWASRITLEVTGVRVERLQDITEHDAIGEGVISSDYDKTYRYAFSVLWDSINAKRGYGWAANPWVWVIEFRNMGRE